MSHQKKKTFVVPPVALFKRREVEIGAVPLSCRVSTLAGPGATRGGEGGGVQCCGVGTDAQPAPDPPPPRGTEIEATAPTSRTNGQPRGSGNLGGCLERQTPLKDDKLPDMVLCFFFQRYKGSGAMTDVVCSGIFTFVIYLCAKCQRAKLVGSGDCHTQGLLWRRVQGMTVRAMKEEVLLGLGWPSAYP
ncbi:hypothetical protein SKAU_G00242300 [Synaphobranchus kaupii]|uniref:Uncharacterized protein n=1 Tax=Synaphobranchus kaupii TaxID=118154 RepID=A0A9Q1F8A4_SYNKA|nr:hypothetical protein SKAU_G00242300 [Synaphobranchus kaupii]